MVLRCAQATVRGRDSGGQAQVGLRKTVLSAIGGLLLTAGPALAAGGPIMPLSQVHAGMDCLGETVIQGTAISAFDVHVIDVVQDPVEGPRILINVSGPAVDRTGVA